MTKSIATVGHSNHNPEAFLKLLKAAHIKQVIDVRSQPYSRFAPHFNLGALRTLLEAHGIEYTHVGELGGRPDDRDMYDSAGHVLYGLLAISPEFKAAIDRLMTTAGTSEVAVMCGEEDPTECHRRLLVGKVLHHRGWNVTHLRGDGRLMSEEELADYSGGVEPGLFEGGEFAAWRSIRSVSPSELPTSSSDH